MTEVVIIEKSDSIATLTLNRPIAYNALSLEVMDSLAANLISIATDPSIRSVILTGSGKAFCSGGDLKWVLAQPEGIVAAFHQLAGRFHHAIVEIRRMPKPVIAAINGIAAGGGFSLALACDFRVMAADAALRQAYTSSGLCIDGGGTFTLPRLVGFARAMEIAAFDRPISSEQALAWQLVTRVAAEGNALAEARSMAKELCARSMHSFGAVKKLLSDSYSNPLELQMEQERSALCACAIADGVEGLRAFIEKRKPVF